MGYMEIALLTKAGLRIKGKHAMIAIDAQDKGTYSAILALSKSIDTLIGSEDSIQIFGVGEYEVGEIKISGVRVENEMIYSLIVDGVSIVVGKLNALEKAHNKLQENNIVIVNCEDEGNASFITSLASSVVIFYGEKASTISASFGKDTVKTQNKYATTKDKLPEEPETILLQ